MSRYSSLLVLNYQSMAGELGLRDQFLEKVKLMISSGKFEDLGIKSNQVGCYPEWFTDWIRMIINEPNPQVESDHAVSAFSHEIRR